MKRKRLLCAVMALVLLFSANPAALASNAGNSRSTVISVSKVRLPVIQVLIPTTGKVYVNPFKIPITIGSNDEESDDQIVSLPSSIVNNSEVPVDVDITVLGSVKEGSDMHLVTSPTRGSGTAKNAFVYFEVQQADTEDLDDVTWDPAYDSSKHVVVVEGVVQNYPRTLTLPPRTLEGEIAPGGYAPFRLTGDAVKTPTVPWTNKDGINVIITYSFTPLSYPAS